MLRRKKRENSSSLKKDKLDLKTLPDFSLLWTPVMLVVLNFLTTWKPCSDHVLWLYLILFLFARTCSCLKVSFLPRTFQRSLCLYICFQDNFYPNKGITIGVLELSSPFSDKLVNSKEILTMKKFMKILCSWEPWEISTFLRSLLMTSLFSLDWFKIFSPVPNLKIRSHPISWKYVKRQPRGLWDWSLKSSSSRNALTCTRYWMSVIVCLSLVLLDAERQQCGKLFSKLIKLMVKMVSAILLILKLSTLMNCSDIILKAKNGEMVSCLLFWRIRISANKNTKRVMFTNGLFWTVMLILSGLSHSTLSWMTTKCLPLFQMIEFLSLPQWDFCLKFQIWKMPVLLQFLEAVCYTSTILISDGILLSLVG